MNSYDPQVRWRVGTSLFSCLSVVFTEDFKAKSIKWLKLLSSPFIAKYDPELKSTLFCDLMMRLLKQTKYNEPKMQCTEKEFVRLLCEAKSKLMISPRHAMESLVYFVEDIKFLLAILVELPELFYLNEDGQHGYTWDHTPGDIWIRKLHSLLKSSNSILEAWRAFKIVFVENVDEQLQGLYGHYRTALNHAAMDYSSSNMADLIADGDIFSEDALINYLNKLVGFQANIQFYNLAIEIIQISLHNKMKDLKQSSSHLPKKGMDNTKPAKRSQISLSKRLFDTFREIINKKNAILFTDRHSNINVNQRVHNLLKDLKGIQTKLFFDEQSNMNQRNQFMEICEDSWKLCKSYCNNSFHILSAFTSDKSLIFHSDCINASFYKFVESNVLNSHSEPIQTEKKKSKS